MLLASAKRRARGATIESPVGIVFAIAQDDPIVNAAAWEGPSTRRKSCDCARDVEPGDPTSIEPAMRAFAERGYDLIIGVGFAQTPIMQQVAKDYPNLNFAIIDGAVPPEEQLPNVAYLLFKEHQGSYLVGMIAARKSQTGTSASSRLPFPSLINLRPLRGRRGAVTRMSGCYDSSASPMRRGKPGKEELALAR